MKSGPIVGERGGSRTRAFPDYYEALEAYHVIDVGPLHALPPGPLELPGVPASAEESGRVPCYAWSLTPSGSLLAQALRGDSPPATRERLCWEMVALCNKAIVLDQIDFADTAAMQQLGHVHAYVNIGLEYLSHHDPQQLVPLLTTLIAVPLSNRLFFEYRFVTCVFPASVPQ